MKHETNANTPKPIMLLSKVAESSINFGREIKLPLYARHNEPEVWLIDLQQKALTIHLAPLDGAYRETQQPHDLACIAPVKLPQVVLDLSDLFRF